MYTEGPYSFRNNMSSGYDFIVVGAGPSGCVVASRLARSAKKPSVLLVEAGGHNKDDKYLVCTDADSISGQIIAEMLILERFLPTDSPWHLASLD